jgi:UDP-2,4-diacetamido-2,4,6-trideoxy-beta-L-altropyranose hydrolase
MRCLALAQAGDANGIESFFVLSSEGIEFTRTRHDWVGRVVVRKGNDTEVAAQILALVDSCHAAAIVLDGYGFSVEFARELKQSKAQLVYLDDTQAELAKYADIIVNPAGEGVSQWYQQQNPQAKVLVGQEYRLLRREFKATLPLPLAQRHTLTINMGGSDPLGLTLPVLQILTKAMPDTLMRVVTGVGYTDIDALDNFIAQSHVPIQHVHNCQDMADIWTHSRLTIGAAGGSQFELVACYTPTILLIVADNQVIASEAAEQQGWCEVLDCRKGLDRQALAKLTLALWHNPQRLEAMHQAAKPFAYIDGADNLLLAIGSGLDKDV